MLGNEAGLGPLGGGAVLQLGEKLKIQDRLRFFFILIGVPTPILAPVSITSPTKEMNVTRMV